jgi:hypothetical protein
VITLEFHMNSLGMPHAVERAELHGPVPISKALFEAIFPNAQSQDAATPQAAVFERTIRCDQHRVWLP